MEEIYLEIWMLAKPYYLQGRPHDLRHAEWMMREADRIADIEKLDKRILLPICILHDVGYANLVKGNPNCKDKDLKIEHMKRGAEIADKVLSELDYEPELKKTIVQCVSVHDNWVLGDDKPFKENKIMALFNDLDFIWVAENKAIFDTYGRSMGLTPKQTYEFWLNDEKHKRRPFCCNETRELWKKLIEERKKEIDA